MTGRILKGIGGFYYVKTDTGLITCKPRGALRKSKMIPQIGDFVEIAYEDPEDGVIDTILPRKNTLIRPPVANIEKLFVIVSTADPSPNPFIIDKTIAIAEVKDIEPVVVITKTDLKQSEALADIYRRVGIKVYTACANNPETTLPLRKELAGVVSVFTGNSGVGKSTLLNCMLPELTLQTGEISKKLGRGRHTTRHVELFPLEGGGYVADTPGFSTLDMEHFEMIQKDQLPYGFREFAPYMFLCKFTSCTHTGEKGCAIQEAAVRGEIPSQRLENYRAMYREVKDVKQWQITKNV